MRLEEQSLTLPSASPLLSESFQLLPEVKMAHWYVPPGLAQVLLNTK